VGVCVKLVVVGINVVVVTAVTVVVENVAVEEVVVVTVVAGPVVQVARSVMYCLAPVVSVLDARAAASEVVCTHTEELHEATTHVSDAEHFCRQSSSEVAETVLPADAGTE